MHINIYKNKIFLSVLSILVISSCQTANKAEKESVDVKTVISEDIKFEEYLSSQWNKNLEDSPVFASLLGNKRFNQEITPNSQEYYQEKINKLDSG